jgi:hypothetical protein
MEIQEDFKELLRLFNEKRVEYLIVGGYALAFHGCPRFTGDIDVYVQPEKDNAKKILEALCEFGFGGIGLSASDFLQPDKVIQLGVPPVRIYIITSITGVSPQKAFEQAASGAYDNVPVKFLSRECLILNKKASGRQKDLADLEALGIENS